MSSEETPLLSSDTSAGAKVDHNEIYKRFSTIQKRTIVALVSWGGLVPFFVFSSFVPTIPSIARDLGTTGAVISLAFGLSWFVAAVGSMIWATYSGFYGRRPIYLTTMPCIVIGSLAVGQATSVPELMIWRAVQAFGASAGMSIGSSVIGDIYKLEERGSAMGIFFSTCLLGTALAPFTGGVTASYASWRVMQYALAVAAMITFILMYFLLPETSHPNSRGVDKLPEGHTRRWVLLNPFRCLLLLRSPNLLLLVFTSFAALLADVVLLVPIAYTLGPKYGITDEAIIGALFIPVGAGNILGAPLAGWLSDYTVVKWRKHRNGEWVPEDRLRAAVVGAAICIPMSLVICGVVTEYVPGILGLTINFASFFMNGVGVDLVMTPVAAYNVDVMRDQSAQLMSAHSGVRNAMIAIVSAFVVPSVTTIGVLPTNLIAAGIAWIGFGFLWATIKYGDRMRAWVDVGYSTAENN